MRRIIHSIRWLTLLSTTVVHGLPVEEMVVTATGTATAGHRLPLASSVIQQIEAVQPTHPHELFWQVPGAWINRGNGQEHLTALRSPVLTGSGACGAFFIAEDGIPSRGAGLCNINQLFELNTEQAQQIDVLRGPSTTRFGSNALHGVIDVRMPEPSQVTPSISLEAGRFDYYRLALREHWQQGDWHTALLAHGESEGGYQQASGYTQQKLNVRTANSNNLLSLSLSNLHQETAGFVEGDDAYQQSGLRSSNPNPEAYRDAKSLRAFWRHQGEYAQYQWELIPYLRHQQMRFIQHYLPGRPIEENRQSGLGIQLRMNWAHASWQQQAGLEWEFNQGALNEFQPSPFVGSPFLTKILPQGWHYDYEVDSQQLGLFWQGTRRWQAHEWTLGARLEHLRYDYDNRMLDGDSRDNGTSCAGLPCRYYRPADRSDLFTNPSWFAGWLYHLSDRQQWYINASQAFRAPQSAELYKLQSGQQVADLDSERMESISAGWRYRWPSGALQADIYRMHKHHVIFQDADRQTVSDATTWHHGVEISLQQQLGERLSLSLNASQAWHRYGNNPYLSTTPLALKGHEIDSAPRHLGAARLTWQWANGSTHLEWQHLGSYSTEPSGQQRYPGHDLLQFRHQWRLAPQWQLGLRVHNLLDRRYAERADYAFGQERYFIGQPRSLYLQIEWSK